MTKNPSLKLSFVSTWRNEVKQSCQESRVSPSGLLEDITEETPTISCWRLRKQVIGSSNLSLAADDPLRMLVAMEKIGDLQESLLY